MKATGEPEHPDPAVPAAATITARYQLGRVLSGIPLALVVFVRQMALFGFDDELAPSFMHLTDQPSGRKIRIDLGRDPVEAERIRVGIEEDLQRLTREAFIEQWAPDWGDPEAS